jgi:biopolymer transport protein ExbD
VCLVLLIIFMVVADKLTRGVEVKLPQAKFFNEKRDTGEDLIVSVARAPSGGGILIYWDRAQLPDIGALKSKVTDELNRRNRPIFLKAEAEDRPGHATLTYGEVYPVMMALHDAGAPNVLLGTVEKDNKTK